MNRASGLPLVLSCICVLLAGSGRAAGPKDEKASADTASKAATQFLADLRAKNINALVKSIRKPWYNGGEIAKTEADVRAALGAMAEWYDERRAKEYKVLAAGPYKKLKTEESSDLGPKDIREMDQVLKGNDWLVILGPPKKPRLYILVKELNGKMTVIGAHKL